MLTTSALLLQARARNDERRQMKKIVDRKRAGTDAEMDGLVVRVKVRITRPSATHFYVSLPLPMPTSRHQCQKWIPSPVTDSRPDVLFSLIQAPFTHPPTYLMRCIGAK